MQSDHAESYTRGATMIPTEIQVCTHEWKDQRWLWAVVF